MIIRNTKYLTPKEKNLLIRLQKTENINYNEFPDMLYNVRYEIASSEMMEQNLDTLEALIYREFKKDDPEGNLEIQIRQAEDALSRCK